jgi:cyclophilin family peptidyl-prolyl cis-trans isomerase
MRAHRLVLPLLGGALALSGLAACGGDDDTAADGAPTTISTPGDTADGTGPGCDTDADAPAADRPGDLDAPTADLDPAKTYTAVMRTSCGDITITLDPGNAPMGAANFAHLARAGFYDGLTFHRVVPGFVVQGGDPSGNGTGDAGYDVVTEAPPGGSYELGAVAWARTPSDAAGTASSQFFIVIADETGLPPDYGYAGMVTGGIENVLAMEMLSAGGDGPPVAPIYIESVEISES